VNAVIPVFASTLGQIFQPLFQAMAWVIAFFYALVPNYAIAIALLTVAVMIVTAPLTVKSTRSMVQMQRLSPELKKLQQKYKGDRQKLNEEMMNLYREHGVNPAGGCLPMIIQFPIFIVLYDVIRGLTNTVKRGQLIPAYSPQHVTCHAAVCASPRYITQHTTLFHDLVQEGGKMPAFGIDLAQKLLGTHAGGWVNAVPYGVLILIAIGLQYLQMRQLNKRNQAFAQANPQAQMMQRYMPLIFAVIYINISAGVNIYFIVSSLCRIGLQGLVFRSGVLDKAKRPAETTVPGSEGRPRRKGFMERLAEAQRAALEAQKARQAAIEGSAAPVQGDNGSRRPVRPPAGGNSGAPGGGAKGSPASGARGRSGSGQTGVGGQGAANKDGHLGGGSNKDTDQGRAAGGGNPSHPRSRAKKTRKAR
jgi:YidC/Oxa1 family membrane protein insertase